MEEELVFTLLPFFFKSMDFLMNTYYKKIKLVFSYFSYLFQCDTDFIILNFYQINPTTYTFICYTV